MEMGSDSSNQCYARYEGEQKYFRDAPYACMKGHMDLRSLVLREGAQNGALFSSGKPPVWRTPVRLGVDSKPTSILSP